MKRSKQPLKRRRPYRPVIRTQADVHEMWQHLIRPLGWHDRRLYLVLVAPDGRPSPVIHEFEHSAVPVTPEDAERFTAFVAEAARDDILPAVRVAMLYCRPGGHPVDEHDRVVCRLLYEAAARHRLPLEVIHFGNDIAITPVPMDDVVAV